MELSANRITENLPAGAVVGNVITYDPDGGSTFTYALVAGAGDHGNGSFLLSQEGVLSTSVSFDYEYQATLSIRIRSTDNAGMSFEKAFTIMVLDSNEAPTDILLNQALIYENASIGTRVGLLSASDVDNTTHTFFLVAGTGGDDNGSFSISGNQLQSA
ncbi:conserved hypothetical protein, partial [sediment metagenome]